MNNNDDKNHDKTTANLPLSLKAQGQSHSLEEESDPR